MNSKELRIGNLIHHYWIDKNGKSNTIIEIYGVMNNFVVLEDNRLPDYLSLHINDVKPIPLTEEWLIKFGLLKANGNYLLGSYEFIYDNPNDRYNVWTLRGIITRIKYVHQLQNLYFALTGEELSYE